MVLTLIVELHGFEYIRILYRTCTLWTKPSYFGVSNLDFDYRCILIVLCFVYALRRAHLDMFLSYFRIMRNHEWCINRIELNYSCVYGNPCLNNSGIISYGKITGACVRAVCIIGANVIRFVFD